MKITKFTRFLTFVNDFKRLKIIILTLSMKITKFTRFLTSVNDFKRLKIIKVHPDSFNENNEIYSFFAQKYCSFSRWAEELHIDTRNLEKIVASAFKYV